MSKKPSMKQQLSHMLEMDVADIASLPALYRHGTHLLRFSYRVIERFLADKCIQRASALAYASLLAIVPMVALGFSVFASFQAFDAFAGSARDILLQYLLPTSQQVVQDYLGSVADKTTALSVFGVIGLLFTATALLNTIEEAFNDIWRITHPNMVIQIHHILGDTDAGSDSDWRFHHHYLILYSATDHQTGRRRRHVYWPNTLSGALAYVITGYGNLVHCTAQYVGTLSLCSHWRSGCRCII